MASTRRRARMTSAAVAAALAILIVAAPVAAGTPPQAVEITSVMQIGGDFNVGDFEQTPGSDLICDEGVVTDTRYVWGASRGRGGNPNGLNLQVDKTFHCGDGLIFMRLQIMGVLADETFVWTILGGTGAYAAVRGQGDGWTDTSDFESCSCVTNYYSGHLVGSA